MVLDKSGKIAYNCKTYKASKKFLEQCEKEGIKWFSNSKATANIHYWDEYKEDTCYQIVSEKYLIYGEVSDFNDCDIITYKVEDSHQPNICPVCGSNNLFYHKSHKDYDNGLDRPWTCEDCGAEGIESYGFIGHYNITVQNKEE